MKNRRDILFSWIEACIRYGGIFGSAEKSAYCQRFGLSEPSASRHQAEFVALFEAAGDPIFERDSNGRVHGGKLKIAADAVLPLKPVFSNMPSLESWLQDNFGGSGYFEIEIPRRDPDPWILRAVIHAMRSKIPVTISYHSRNGESERTLSPHAIIRIAGRLHMRAYDHAKNSYLDFVLSRITAATFVKNYLRYIDREADSEWHRQQAVLVQAVDNDMQETVRLGIQLDYALGPSGLRKLVFRAPFVQYLIDEMDPGYKSPVKIAKFPQAIGKRKI